MLEHEPLSYPSRTMDKFPYDPGIPNRQMWAIGMIVVQWSMTEFFVDIRIRELIRNDTELLARYELNRHFKQRLDFWQTQIESGPPNPLNAHVRQIMPRIRNLSSQRDEVVHRAWAGGMEGSAWSSAGELVSADAQLLMKPGKTDRKKSAPPRDMLRWDLTFNRLRRMAQEMSVLNRDLMQLFT